MKKFLLILSIICLSLTTACTQLIKTNHAPLTNKKYTILDYKRNIFNEFLNEIKPIINKHYNRLNTPRIFISYSWEDLNTKDGKKRNEKLQNRLSRLYSDLRFLGIYTFLDIHSLDGEIRHTVKSEILKSDFIFLIGTNRLKENGNRDRLFMLPYFDPRLIPASDNIIALVKEPDFYAVYYLENGKLKDIVTLKIDSINVEWIEKNNGIKEAEIGESTNRLIEDLFLKIPNRTYKKISNIQFEFGLSVDKHRKNQKTLVPLILSGTIEDSFPSIIKNTLIRDISTENIYYNQMSALSNPLGIIISICPELMKDHEYITVVEKFEKKLK